MTDGRLANRAGLDTKASHCLILSAFRRIVFGLSVISNPIDQEGLRQIDNRGSANLLFYLGFDVAFALADLPNTELVLRIQHRSGAYGTLGGMKEGNNANVIGIRQRF